jgi:CelD/BcsL family acetyltransferase involved in cellulose biosynthesis
VNVFSSPVVLQALADVYYPGRPTRIATYRIAGSDFQLLALTTRNGRPLTRLPFVDFWEPLDPGEARAGAGEPGVARYLPRVHVDTVAATGCAPELQGLSVAPFVRLSDFDQPSAYWDLIASRNRSLLSDSRRQLRRLEREFGAATFTFQDPETTAAVDACLGWKARRSRSAARFFSDQRHRNWLLRVNRAGVGHASTLRLDGRIVAVHLGLIENGRLYYAIPAYEPELARYSPGRLLLEWLLGEAFRLGLAEVDLLIGNEPYKWNYATHARRIGDLGRAPLVETAVAAARRRLRVGRRLRRVRRVLRPR